MKENTWSSEKEARLWEEMDKPVLPGYAVSPSRKRGQAGAGREDGGRPAYLTGGRGPKGTAGTGTGHGSRFSWHGIIFG